MPGQAWTVMVRSPHPHARIVRIDTAPARAMPGVLAVFTGADCLVDGLRPIDHNPVPSTKYDMKLTGRGGGAVFVVGRHRLLPADKARYFGEAVAMVVAESREEAEDAADAVAVEYEPLRFLEETEDAVAPGAPAVWDEAPDNVLVDTLFGDRDAADLAFAAADDVIGSEFHVGRIMPLPLEPRAGLAHYDGETGRYTLYFSTGGPGYWCGRSGSLPPRSTSMRKNCGWSPSTPAAISAPRTAPTQRLKSCQRGRSRARYPRPNRRTLASAQLSSEPRRSPAAWWR